MPTCDDLVEKLAFASGPRWQVKMLTILPTVYTSMHRHLHRAERFVVVSGVLAVEHAGDDFQPGDLIKSLYNEGEPTNAAQGEWHRLSNPGKIPAVVVETWLGSYLDDEDIIRHGGCPK